MMGEFGLQLGDKKKVQTAIGVRWVSSGPATPEFWDAWKTNKAALKARGYSPNKYKGEWMIDVWEKDEEFEAEAAAAVKASRAEDADIDVPRPRGLEYLPFQRGGIAYALQREGTLIGDEMGLGKTIQGIGLANATAPKRILIGCPASLKGNWRAEIQKWQVLGLPVFTIDPGVKLPIPPLPSGWYIVNWQAVSSSSSGTSKRNAELLTAVDWDLMILDECHELKNPKALRTRFFLGYWDETKNRRVRNIRAKRRLCLTGTPICNRPKELFTVINFLDEKAWPSSSNFQQRYCGAVFTSYGMDSSGASNLDELQIRLRQTVMVRRLKKDVLKELPAKWRQVIALSIAEDDDATQALVDEENEFYDNFERETEEATYEAQKAEAEGNTNAYDAAVARLKAAKKVAFSKMAKLRHETAVRKVPYVLEHLKEFNDDSKRIIFCHHNDVAEMLVEGLKHRGARMMTQATPVSDRQALAQAFQTDPEFKDIIGTIGTMGVGLTLTAASFVAMVELDWTPGRVSQAEDRAHRIGQTDSVTVQHIVLDGSLDSKMAKLIVAKQEIIERALDREAPAKIAASDELAAMEQTVERAPVPELDEPISIVPEEEPKVSLSANSMIVLTPEQIAAVHRALQVVAGYDEDRANYINGMGFSKMDTRFGCELAQRAYLTPRQASAAAKMVRKYRKQYSKELYAEIFGSSW